MGCMSDECGILSIYDNIQKINSYLFSGRNFFRR